ncbi:MAG: hypothetical protein H6819_03885 [Phycisphaerales bacterium]|nr:hypothetical protein [Phycisphaerales bacterium]MCB9856339.1 hypothetical protein [Phycisphaerales bacterium]MCB9864011.1 hypothetical protein [Phycisphaerales bacterium]
MRRPRLRSFCILIPAMAALACNQPEDTTSINTPPTDPAESRKELAQFFAYHQDQGMIHDRSIADIHFVPGTVFLSGTGEACLARYAELLSETGGTLNYDTRLADATLVNGRLGTARQFLSRYNVGGPQIQVALGMPGGRGMSHFETAAGQAVAQQPEPRGTAYRLTGASGVASSGSN